MGSLAYKLELPSSSAIHPEFHVSQLKHVVPPTTPIAQLPVRLDGLQVPELVLCRCLDSAGSLQVLITWSGMQVSLATWEDYTALHQSFPSVCAWGQAGFLPGGMWALLLPLRTDVHDEQAAKEVAMLNQKDEENGTKATDAKEPRPRRSNRARRANVRLSGPEWCWASSCVPSIYIIPERRERG